MSFFICQFVSGDVKHQSKSIAVVGVKKRRQKGQEMTFTEILKALELTDEQVESIQKEMKDNKIYTSSEENLDVRYRKLKDEHDSLKAKFGESSKLIEDLKGNTALNESLQTKLTEYETTIATLQESLDKQKLDAAIKIALLDAHVSDIDYMTYKLKEGNELSLDDAGNIVGITDKLDILKTQYPAHFGADAQKAIDVQKLEDSAEPAPSMTKAEFLKKSYSERAIFAQENPEAYNELMGH